MCNLIETAFPQLDTTSIKSFGGNVLLLEGHRSEASCEREISELRQFIRDRRFYLSEDTLDYQPQKMNLRTGMDSGD
ncbi:hypothetical protein BLNAU_16582 [Blattamonas nauphoetae]|uniref:Uncharacterized protein n=1 Tax=Blattamonas nauphoetae TaxID=2049346 RepID=A0ABQ9XB73_9EUKA|nr:hypothetical protein BLNAU_16582 [Blattamonas nauphoetae]